MGRHGRRKPLRDVVVDIIAVLIILCGIGMLTSVAYLVWNDLKKDKAFAQQCESIGGVVVKRSGFAKGHICVPESIIWGRR